MHLLWTRNFSPPLCPDPNTKARIPHTAAFPTPSPALTEQLLQPRRVWHRACSLFEKFFPRRIHPC